MAIQALRDIGNVILEPAPTFARLKEKNNAWWPLMGLILLTLAVTYWWVSTLDIAWFQEHMLASNPAVKPEARAVIARFLTPSMMWWTSAGGVVVGTLLLFAVTAAYYLIAANMLGSQLGYGKWFSFVAWVSVPRLLLIPLMALQVATSHGRLGPEDMNMASLNFLLFHLPLSNPWSSFVTNIDIATLWSCALAAIGLKAWTGRTTGTCVFVAVLPYVIVYGLWAVKIAVFQ